jgi:RNA polymerase sigma factor (sigma-70 family)
MTGAATGRQKVLPAHFSDERLIGRCLKGDQEAWSALIDKYKNLIYSVPMKLGMHQDASDIFQSVCVDLLAELPRLREHRALPKWLMQTCYHKCLHYRRASDRLVELAPEGADSDAALPASGADDLPSTCWCSSSKNRYYAMPSQSCRKNVSGWSDCYFSKFLRGPTRTSPRSWVWRRVPSERSAPAAWRQLRKQLEKRGF